MCGGVRFEVTEAPLFAGYCHCTRCQRRTGTAASISARIPPGSLHVTKGAELIKAYEPPDGFHKLFCSECGSALWSQDPEDVDVVSVRLGAFDADTRVRRRLLELADAYGAGDVAAVVPLTQEDVAAMAGTSRATVNRVLRDEQRRGAVALARGRVSVLDRGELERRCRFRG